MLLFIFFTFLIFFKDIQPLKQKTTAVLAESTELVTRLEHECKAAEEALEAEIRRRKKLYLHSDYLSLWRLQQLPIAVQKGMEIPTGMGNIFISCNSKLC